MFIKLKFNYSTIGRIVIKLKSSYSIIGRTVTIKLKSSCFIKGQLTISYSWINIGGRS